MLADGRQDGVVVVLGASSGVGAEVLQRLRGQGWAAAGMSRRSVPNPGMPPSPSVDVRDRRSVEEAVRALPRPVDAVVNCVGVGFYAPWNGDYSREWSEMAGTNVAGLANVLSVVASMNPEPATYLHIGSMAAHRPSNTPGNAVYSATKVAVRELLNDFRRWCRASNRRTRIMALSPALISGTDFDTNFFRADEANRRPLYDRPHLTVPQVAEVVLWMLSQPDDVEVSDLLLRHGLQND